MIGIARMAGVLCAGVAVLVAGCGTSASDKAGDTRAHAVVLTLADGETDTSNAQAFAAAVKQLSRGTLLVTIKSPWRANDLRYEGDLIKDVRAGKAQLGITASRAFDTVGVDSFEALQAPFLIDSVALERRVLASDLAGRMLAGVRQAGLVGLALLPGPLRRPMGFSRPFLSLADYRGARIGIRPSLVTEDTLRALGARPVVLPGPYNTVSTSGLDGVVGHLTQLDASLAMRGATITGNVDFEPRPNVIFINRRAFESLTAGQRSVLTRAARAQATAAIFEADGGIAADLCRRGVRILTAPAGDLAKLRAAVRPVYASLESNPSTKTFINRIASMRDAIGGPTDAAGCATATAAVRVTQPASELQGGWHVTYTEQELNAAGADPSEDLPANYGHETLGFEGSHWTNAGPHVGPGAGTASGTYVVHGDEITFYRHDQAYPGSDTEVWGPYIWSTYRDTLTFRKGKDFAQGPTGLVVKPWRRS
jgi:TRAP-type C4-dicarboxylate transport system substrate-binding protein